MPARVKTHKSNGVPAGASGEAPLVSVVITTYNRPEYLEQALASAINQTYSHLDILISDNHSKPNHYAAIKSIVSSFDDDRIRLVQRPENVGLQHNNVWALRDARGVYVANLHDDDVWEPTFVERMVEALNETPEATMAFCDHYLIDAGGKILHERTEENSAHWNRTMLSHGVHQPFARIGLIDRSIPGVMGAMYRHDAIDWDAIPEPATAYDLWLIYLACREGAPAFYVDERLTRYRVHDASQTSRGLFRLHHDLAYCYEAFARDNRLTDLADDLRWMASRYHCSIAATYMRASKAEPAREHFDRAIDLSYNYRSLMGWFLGRMPRGLSERILRWRRQLLDSCPTPPPEDLTTPEITRAALKLQKSSTDASSL